MSGVKQISLLWILKYITEILNSLLVLFPHTRCYNSHIFLLVIKKASHFKNIYRNLSYIYNINVYDFIIKNQCNLSVHFLQIKSKTKKSLCRNLYDFDRVESKKFIRLQKHELLILVLQRLLTPRALQGSSPTLKKKRT